MNSTAPFGSAIASETPHSTAELCEIPQSSADFRPNGPAPETLIDLLPFVDKDARRRWNKTFKLIAEWKGLPPSEILLRYLFLRSSVDGFRPFLRECGYLENTIVHHRKGLKYLRDLAATLGVEVEPVWKEAWREVMARAKESHCLIFAEHFEAECESPIDVTVEAVKAFTDDLVRTRQKHKSGAKRVKNWFLAVLRQCGFVKNQSPQAARQSDYGERLENLPEPLKSQLTAMRDWSLKTEDEGEWDLDWDNHRSEDGLYLALRRKTADATIANICRFYEWVKNICHKEEGINSLETLFLEKIVRSYQSWQQKVRKCEGGSMCTAFSGMFSMLKNYRGTSTINLTWTTAFIKALPKTSQKKRSIRKAPRVMHFSALELIPASIRKDLNILIARHNRAERAEQKRTIRKEGSFSQKKLDNARATRLTRMASLAQSLLIIRYLLTLVWRNENLCECRINPDLGGPTDEQRGGKKPWPNLWRGPVFPVPGLHIPEWASKQLDHNPETPLLQFHFNEDETKAGRTVDSILPQTLIDDTVEFVNTWRKILVEGLEDPGTLFVNQAGNSMGSEQIEFAVEEATLRYGGEESRSVNPHLFRDIYAAAFLLDPDHYADYLTLSKILWHECIEITVRTYSWIFNESVGTNAAGQFAEERDFKRSLREAGIKIDLQKHGANRVPAPPPSGYHEHQRRATQRGRK